MPKSDQEIPLRIIVMDPPEGVIFALQRGKSELVSSTMATREDLSFELDARVATKEGEPPNFLGPYVQGPKGGRFIYINSGTSAGQYDSCWTRRAKISLKGITGTLIEQVLAKPSGILEARIAGKGKDGGPACATVPFLNEGWKVIARV